MNRKPITASATKRKGRDSAAKTPQAQLQQRRQAPTRCRRSTKAQLFQTTLDLQEVDGASHNKYSLLSKAAY
ncbi:MAG: hypothetical protein LDLANPLL_01838 [Turneriella sp.]|nr:hypothetical protein [Turneriella sp.]